MTTATAPTPTGAPASQQSSAYASLHWPTGEPSWQKTLLEEMAKGGTLGNVPPQIIAYLSKWESGYGVAGLAINPKGYGGYLGEGSATYGKGTFTSAELTTASQASFKAQAEYAASSLTSYGHSLLGDLREYVTGTPAKASNEATSIVRTSGAASAQLANVQIPGWAFVAPGVYAATKATGGSVSGVAAIGQFFTTVGTWLGSGFHIGWAAVASIVLGIVLIGIGLALLGFSPLEQLGKVVPIPV